MIDHWKNDFLIISQRLRALEDLLIYENSNLYCYTRMQNVTVPGNTSVIILGRIFDIDDVNLSPEDIALKLQGCHGTCHFDVYIQSLSGRYIIIINESLKTNIYPDTCASLSLFYGKIGDVLTAGSSVKLINELLNDKPNISTDVKNFLSSAEFKNNGCYWIGESAIDNKYRLLLANHFLEFNGLTSIRRNIKSIYLSYSYAEKVDLYAKYMVNSLRVVDNKELMIPVTAGIDSRIIYAASKNLNVQANYYLFNNGYNSSDIEIGSEISRIGGDMLKIYKEPTVPQAFDEAFKQLFYYSTEDDRISHYYHHFRNDAGKMNINGNGGDIIRGYYGFYSATNALSILKYTGYSGHSFLVNGINDWLSNIQLPTDVSVKDLLYWEQKTSNWFGRYQYEKNFFIGDFSPYNNYKLMMIGFSVPFQKRRAYKNTFQLDVVSALYPKIDRIPINPEKKLLHIIKLKAYQNHLFWVIFNKLRRLI